MAIRRDAQTARQALILGTEPEGGSTVLPLLGVEKTVLVAAPWIEHEPDDVAGTPVGGVAKVWLTTAPQPEGRVRVGAYEQHDAAIGPVWRASVWTSALAAATLLGKDLTDLRVSADASQAVDGTSLGALMTAGFLASLTGATVDATTTMLGVVHPDGTVGPVPNLAEAVSAAVTQGIRRVGVPVGMRRVMPRDPAGSAGPGGGASIDIASLARAAGARVFEIGDVGEAYALLTHARLPETRAVETADMALDQAVETHMGTLYAELRARALIHWTDVIELTGAGTQPPALLVLARAAADEAQAAENLILRGLAAAAYDRMARAWLFAETAAVIRRVVERARAGDMAGARTVLEGLAMAGESERALARALMLRPATMGEHLRALSALQEAVAAHGIESFATAELAGELAYLGTLVVDGASAGQQRAQADELAARLAPAVLALMRGRDRAGAALLALDVGDAPGPSYAGALPGMRRLAASYSSVAALALERFETSTVPALAAELDVPDAQAMRALMRREPGYMTAKAAFRLRELRAATATAGRMAASRRARTRLELAASILAYHETSVLASSWYSLDARRDPLTGEAISVASPAALAGMLRGAERKARQHAHAARVAIGVIPVQARLSYQRARLLTQGRIPERLRALALYWESSQSSQLAVMLARN